MNEAVIVAAKRTPIGKVRQSLAEIDASKLGAMAIKAVLTNTGIDPKEIDEVIIGNLVNYNWANIARVACLEAGLPVTVPAVTLDRQCTSSLNAVAYGALLINSGNSDIVLAGGVESFSQQPLMLQKPTQAYPTEMSFLPMKVSIESIGNPTMIEIAEKLASIYKLTRVQCDEFALRSHQLAADAWNKGRFSDQVFPVIIPQKRGDSIEFKIDECVRFDSNIETLGKLKPIINNGIVTAGNSSPINDGASMILLMNKMRADALGLEVLAKVTAFASVGIDPNVMGLGPISATQKLLHKTGLEIKDIDLFEINEAFASQVLPCVYELGIDIEKLNVNGGAIAIGHPSGASGGILVARLVYEMRRRDVKRGVVSFCVGGGQGFSVLFERD